MLYGRKLRILFPILAFFTFCRPVSAETIILEDGKEIVGDIAKETDTAVVISRSGGAMVFTISKSRIKEIRGSTAEEVERENRQSARHSTPKELSEADAERKRKLEAYRMERYEKEVEAAKRARGRIKIPFSEGRDGVVDVVLNGKVTVPFYVDTGASLCVLSQGVADRLGLTEDDAAGTIRVMLANGSVDTATAVKLDSVQVGSSKAKNVEAAISDKPPGGGVDGLLGMSFLKHFHVKLDSKEHCLILEKY